MPRNDSIEVKKETQSLTCIECTSEYKSKELLADHIIQTHTKIKCKLCMGKFDNSLALKKHYSEDHFDKNFVCDKCDKTFVIEDLLKEHQTEKHELFCVCGICKQGFQSFKELGEHFKIHKLQPKSLEKIHNKPLKKKSEKTKKVMQRKRIAKILFKANSCDICDETFENADQLSSHISKEHEETYRCAICVKIFSNAEILQGHLREAFYLINEKCNFCDKTFVSSCEKTVHMKECPKKCTNIVKPRHKPFGCGHCDKIFDSANQLAHHVRYHPLTFDYKCQFCQKKFINKHFLDVHVQNNHKS